MVRASRCSRSGLRFARQVGALLAVLVVVLGCETNVIDRRVAMQMPNAVPDALVFTCPEHRDSLNFQLVETSDQTIGGPQDRVLWEIESVSPAQISEIVIGQTPDGFTEVIPFSETWDNVTQYAAVATWGERMDAMVFKLEQLPHSTNEVLYPGGIVPVQEWQDAAASMC